jgi:hypothetical protein
MLYIIIAPIIFQLLLLLPSKYQKSLVIVLLYLPGLVPGKYLQQLQQLSNGIDEMVGIGQNLQL